MTKCTIEGCSREATYRAICHTHHTRFKRYGTYELSRKPPEARFWAKVDKSAGAEGCWPWTGARNWQDYGIFKLAGGTHGQSAHRYTWEVTNGRIPDGLQVLHRCDNPPCCNPAHLWLGTNTDNVADKMAKGRAKTARGETNRHAKLTADQVKEIRALGGTMSQEKIGQQFGVSQVQISNILRGDHWKHI